jgi:aspartyl/glutamyl-tRNA(Asn/Gln) amidotransferase, C subunit
MAKITRQELLKIAQISCVELHEDEINPTLQQLENVLNYIQRMQKIVVDAEEPSTKAVNVFREDVAIKTDPEPLLQLAPDREEDFFVVPKILDN